MSGKSSILIDPEIQGGTPCVSGTRVPVKSLFDALAHGRSVDYFLEQFPSVRPEQVRDVLEQAQQLLLAEVAAKGRRQDFESYLATVPDREPSETDHIAD